MLSTRVLALAVCVVLAVTWRVQATPTFDTIDTWVGTGDNKAALVIDWNDGNNPTLPGGDSQSLIWGYRWTGDATGEDMLRAVANNASLTAKITEEFPSGSAVLGLGHDANGNGTFSITDGTNTDSFTGVLISTSSEGDGHTAVESGDRYEEGWNTAYWGYSVNSLDDLGGPENPYKEGQWRAPINSEGVYLGISDRTLQDGSWDGFSFAPNFNTSNPSVPEPASMALVGIGGALMFARPRRRRQSCC